MDGAKAFRIKGIFLSTRQPNKPSTNDMGRNQNADVFGEVVVFFVGGC